MKASAAAESLHGAHIKQVSLASERIGTDHEGDDQHDDFDEGEMTASVPPAPPSVKAAAESDASPVKETSRPASATRRRTGWKRLLCCVSSHAVPDAPNHDRTPQKKATGQTEPLPVEPVPAGNANTSEVNVTKIKSSRKWTSIFKRKEREAPPAVVLTSVTKQPHPADERLKTPAPYLLVTRHNEANAADQEYNHCDENGIAVGACHLGVDDRMSESTNSRDSLRTDDSYSEPADQVSNIV